MSNNFNGMYRGVIVGNADDKGVCRVFVPGVNPSEFEKTPNALPPAEPAMSLFGGNASVESGNLQTGWAGWPAVGAHVWVFFNQGDHMFPVYFAACQGGDGWIAEHNKQHVIQTEKISIVFDDSPADGSRNALLSIDVVNEEDGEALEVNIQGNVVVNIQGDVTQTIYGNVEETIVAETVVQDITASDKLTRIITADIEETITGDITRTITGNVTENVTGTVNETATGAVTKSGLTLTNLATGGAAIMAGSAGATIGYGGASPTSSLAVNATDTTANVDINTSGEVSAKKPAVGPDTTSVKLSTHKHGFTPPTTVLSPTPGT